MTLYWITYGATVMLVCALDEAGARHLAARRFAPRSKRRYEYVYDHLTISEVVTTAAPGVLFEEDNFGS